MKKKVVLAYSGGLDTSFCCIYLTQDLGYEVHSVIVNTGGFSEEELKGVEERAYKMGVTSHHVVDETENFYNTCVRFLIYGNVLKNNTYPLSVSAERVSQATAIANYAKEIGAEFVAHGSTGAGNDQVRFDMIFNILVPEVQIITPIRDLKLSREEEIQYLKDHGVEMNFEKAKYSINKGIWGTSVGGKETLTSNLGLPEEAWPTQISKSGSQNIELVFENGELIGIDGEKFSHPTKAIQTLQAIAQPYGIGRDIHVGDTIIGIKGRVGFEAAAPMIIIKAHHTLEKHVLTKWQLSWKDQLSSFYGNWLHEGQFHDPIMRNIEAFLTDTQKNVSGKVFVQLHPYRFQVVGIESAHDLMSNKFGTYGEMNNSWSGEDVKGFSKIFGNQVMIYHKVNSPSPPDPLKGEYLLLQLSIMASNDIKHMYQTPPLGGGGRILAGIVGGAGYTGGEMLRILINHPDVDIAFVHSTSSAGKHVYDVHTDLFGDTDLKFAAELAYNIDVLFLCVGHGDSKKFLDSNPIPDHIKVIDLSQDFRLTQSSKHKSKTFVYGLPELNREAIKQANNIANPGCFATCLQLGLLPLAAKNLLNTEVHITATTGSTGAGQSLSGTTHFTWRNDNLSVYKAFEHQHLNEVGQSLRQLQPQFDKAVNFIPYRGDYTRGIIASIYTDSSLTEAEALKLYQQYYAGHPFTHVTNHDIDLKQVVNTNKCFIQVKKHGNKLLIISIIDNLLKGASGQAVQNMNLMFGLEERAGLRLKATGF